MKKMSLDKMAKINGGYFWPLFRVTALLVQDTLESIEQWAEDMKKDIGVDTGVGPQDQA